MNRHNSLQSLLDLDESRVGEGPNAAMGKVMKRLDEIGAKLDVFMKNAGKNFVVSNKQIQSLSNEIIFTQSIVNQKLSHY